jgi:hypothetical protein
VTLNHHLPQLLRLGDNFGREDGAAPISGGGARRLARGGDCASSGAGRKIRHQLGRPVVAGLERQEQHRRVVVLNGPNPGRLG